MMTIHRCMKTYYSIVVDVIKTEYRQAGRRANAFEMNAHRVKIQVKIVSNDRRGMIDGHEEMFGKGLRKGSQETKNISRMIINAFSFFFLGPLYPHGKYIFVSQKMRLCVFNICFFLSLPFSLSRSYVFYHHILLCVLNIMLPFCFFRSRTFFWNNNKNR